MKTKFLFLSALILAASACSPFTMASSSVDQTTPAVETISATGSQPVDVNHVEVTVGVGSPIPVEIIASGTWPQLCAQIAEVKSQINGFQIDVTLLASTAESCRPDHLGLPFRFALPLNMAELQNGTYNITVNSSSTTFEWPVKSDEMTGSISGWVWHDECVSGLDGQPALTSTPPGCVNEESPIGPYHANGLLDQTEAPIESIIVKLREGDCTATSLTGVKDEIMTLGSDLSYTFMGLKAGTYCVSIDPQAEPNFTLLQPGLWTYPYVTQSIIAETVTIAAGENRLDVNFGWDHQFK